MSERLEDFYRHRELLDAAEQAPRLVLLPPNNKIERLLTARRAAKSTCPPRYAERLTAAGSAEIPASGQALLASLANAHDRQRLQQRLDGTQREVVQAIAGAFGLGSLAATMDKVGGNVDTPGNMRKGIYATTEQAWRYKERGPYDATACHTHQAYKNACRQAKAQQQAGTLIDFYTGKPIPLWHRNNPMLRQNVDHIVASSRVHDCPVRVAAGLSTADAANHATNLVTTTQTTNCSKGNRSAREIARLHQATAGKRQRRLEQLSGNGDLTDKERRERDRLQEQQDFDPARLQAKEEQAQAAIDREMNRIYWRRPATIQAVALTSAAEGAKTGLQQALGTVIVEFFLGCIEEVRDLCRHGRRDDSRLLDAGMRLRRVANRVAKAWKPTLAALGGGFVAGLLSNLATVVLNALKTTSRRAVRMIREGAMSIVQAVKLVATRPTEMSLPEALHEASKVLVGAGILVGGLAIENISPTSLHSCLASASWPTRRQLPSSGLWQRSPPALQPISSTGPTFSGSRPTRVTGQSVPGSPLGWTTLLPASTVYLLNYPVPRLGHEYANASINHARQCLAFMQML